MKAPKVLYALVNAEGRVLHVSKMKRGNNWITFSSDRVVKYVLDEPKKRPRAAR